MRAVAEVSLARFRLRFLLPEFDLRGPEVIIGRSPDCHISIEDPLVSRQHAKIRIEDGQVWVSDLGSRNGVRVNGRQAAGEVLLMDGDRIRLGTQELVFSVVQRLERAGRPTGFMCMCRACATPYPEGAPSCPHCGAPPQTEDETTISGLRVEPQRGFTLQLLTEVIGRAINQGKNVEADKLMRRAAKDVEERLAAGDRLEPHELATLSALALRVAALIGASEWVSWTLTVHRKVQTAPSDDVVERLAALDVNRFPEVPRLVAAFVRWWQAHPTAAKSSSVARLELLASRAQA
jgi:FHA domain